MVTFLHYWALAQFVELAEYKGRRKDVETYTALMRKIEKTADKELWDKKWYIRGITKNGRKIGTDADKEGNVHLESNAWAVLSGAVPYEKGIKAMDS